MIRHELLSSQHLILTFGVLEWMSKLYSVFISLSILMIGMPALSAVESPMSSDSVDERAISPWSWDCHNKGAPA